MVSSDKKAISLKERRRHVRPSGSDEKRDYIRTESLMPITVYIKEGNSTSGVKSHTRNISATGMMVESTAKLPVGIEAKLEFNPSGAHNPVHCSGKIIWVTQKGKGGKYYSGIKLTKIEEDNKNTFLKFLCDAIYDISSIG